jgi:hypothetical protein
MIFSPEAGPKQNPEPMSVEDIGKLLGLSGERVRVLKHRALKKLGVRWWGAGVLKCSYVNFQAKGEEIFLFAPNFCFPPVKSPIRVGMQLRQEGKRSASCRVVLQP